MIYADFESIFVTEGSENQSPEESYMNKHQKHVACSYGYKLVCVDDKFSKPFKSYLDQHGVYNFINSMTEEIKYHTNIMKKHYKRELVMPKMMIKILKHLLNVGFVIMFLLSVMLKQEIIVISLEDKECLHIRDCNINVN